MDKPKRLYLTKEEHNEVIQAGRRSASTGRWRVIDDPWIQNFLKRRSTKDTKGERAVKDAAAVEAIEAWFWGFDEEDTLNAFADWEQMPLFATDKKEKNNEDSQG